MVGPQENGGGAPAVGAVEGAILDMDTAQAMLASTRIAVGIGGPLAVIVATTPFGESVYPMAPDTARQIGEALIKVAQQLGAGGIHRPSGDETDRIIRGR